MSTYNGWTNYETWLVNLWFGEAFDDEAQHMSQGILTGDRAKEVVENYLDSVEALTPGFVSDVVNTAIGAVNWDEIADHYQADEPEADAALDAWRDKEHETDGEA